MKAEKRFSESEKVFRESLAGLSRALGPDHPDTANSAYSLACVLAQEGKRDEAFVTLRMAMEHGLASETRRGMDKDDDHKPLRGEIGRAHV